jgi:hypothetical protein
MKTINFSSQWRRIEPLLNEPDVKMALTFGLFIQTLEYKPGDPPWLEGRGPLSPQCRQHLLVGNLVRLLSRLDR